MSAVLSPIPVPISIMKCVKPGNKEAGSMVPSIGIPNLGQSFSNAVD
jgi:hypothetical protein